MLPNHAMQLTAGRVGRRFEFKKSSQLFIRMNDKAIPIVAMRVRNENRSPV